jgi:hypothetical protein
MYLSVVTVRIDYPQSALMQERWVAIFQPLELGKRLEFQNVERFSMSVTSVVRACSPLSSRRPHAVGWRQPAIRKDG